MAFIQILRLEDMGFWPGSGSRKTQLFNPYIEAERHTLIRSTPPVGSMYKNNGRRLPSSFPACPGLASLSIPLTDIGMCEFVLYVWVVCVWVCTWVCAIECMHVWVVVWERERECVWVCVYVCVATTKDKEAMTLENSKVTTWQMLTKAKNWENEIIVFSL